ncbi:MAG: TIGR03620 family F420-dependent LLM class oxidoreductase [Pseudonocardiaceae bacterium]
MPRSRSGRCRRRELDTADVLAACDVRDVEFTTVWHSTRRVVGWGGGCERSRQGRAGAGAVALSSGDWGVLLDAAPELEDLGYSTIWIAGAMHSELDRVADMARVTRHVLVGTGIIAVDHFPAETVTAAFAEMEMAHPGRFVVGLGGAHGPTPLQTLGTYLDRLDGGAPIVPRDRRVLAALGPRMLDLARDRTAGALPVLATPEYTAQARARLGADAVLVIQQMVILDNNATRARHAARQVIGFLRDVEGGYRKHFHRMGFTEEDITQLSDRLIDALVVWGDLDTIARRISEYRAAGADQVALTVLPGEGSGAGSAVPLAQWRELAGAVVPGRPPGG